MDHRIILFTLAVYILSASPLTSATCREQCSIQCPPSLIPTTSPFQRFWNRNYFSRCRRECSYLCEGQVLQIPSYVRRRRVSADNTKILLPFPFAVEFYDEDADNQISYSEFTSTVKCEATDPETRRAFNMADTNDDQLISREELSLAPFRMFLDDDDDDWRRGRGGRGRGGRGWGDDWFS